MKIEIAAATAALICPTPGLAAPTQAQDLQAIERLHQLDLEATCTDKADEFVKLWDREAIRFPSKGPAEIGRDVIYAHDKASEKTNASKTLGYKVETQNIQIAGDWAFEWNYFEYSFRPSPGAQPKTFEGKQVRIMRRQPDGEWKFARVIALAEPKPEERTIEWAPRCAPGGSVRPTRPVCATCV
jgi:ketosteroid isomerase-like protein